MSATISEIQHMKAHGKSIGMRYEAIIENLKCEQEMAAIAFDMTNLDYAKMYKDYADAIGITADGLTCQQKQQAVMDAILKGDT